MKPPPPPPPPPAPRAKSSMGRASEKLCVYALGLAHRAPCCIRQSHVQDIENNLKTKVLSLRNDQEAQLSAAGWLYKESRDLKTDRKIRALFQQDDGNVDIIDVSGPNTSRDRGLDTSSQQPGVQVEVHLRCKVPSLPHKGQRRKRTRRTTKMRRMKSHRGPRAEKTEKASTLF